MAAQPLRDILKNLIVKAGLDVTDVKFADVLSLTTTVDDSVAAPLADYVNGSMSLEGAKNNPALEVHFKGKTLSPMEAELKKLWEEYGLDDTSVAELKAETSTYKKVGALTKKIADLTAQKANATGSDKKALTDKISELNNQILEAKTKYEGELKKAKEDAENEILSFAIGSELSAKTYSEAIPEAIRISGANDLLQKELAARGIKAVRDGKNIKLVMAANPEMAYFENNKEVSFSDFATTAVRPMLKVSDPNQNPAQPTSRIITDPKVNKGAQGVADFNAKQAQQFETNSKVAA